MISIGLFQPKHDPNIGSALRAATCFGADAVIIQGRKKVNYSTDTPRTWKHLPIIFVDNLLKATPAGSIPVCVEIGEDSISLPNFTHPKNAYYIFGPEDGSIPEPIQKSCYCTVSIPTTRCLNLGATVNVLLYDRIAKEQSILNSLLSKRQVLQNLLEGKCSHLKLNTKKGREELIKLLLPVK